MRLRTVAIAVVSCALASLFVAVPAHADQSSSFLIFHPDFVNRDDNHDGISDNRDEISLVGTATADTYAQLTDGGLWQAGALWDTRAIDSSQNWETTFKLGMIPSGGRADGIAFVLQDRGLGAIGESGGWIGYGGIAPSLAVEFDIYANEWDPDNNHVAITTNGDVSQPIAVGTLDLDLAGDSFRAWISYDAPTQRLKVSVSQEDTPPQTPVVEADVNIPAIFPHRLMFAGFTAATGAQSADQVVQDWSLSGMPGSLVGGAPIDFLATQPSPPTGGACTAGFTVVKNGSRYVLTVGHCRAGRDRGAVWPGDSRKTPYLNEADCTGASSNCLVASRKAKFTDMMAWKPDSATPLNLVQTGQGLQRVLGSAKWKKGREVCWWGRTAGHEVCGKVLGKNWNPASGSSGYVKMEGSLMQEGDSGGPVYSYVRDDNGLVVGVSAIGISEQTAENILTHDRWSEFLAIAEAEKELGVRVLAP